MTPSVLAKADPLLADKFNSASSQEVVKVVLALIDPGASSDHVHATTATEYRIALTNRRRHQIALVHTETIKSLKLLHLNPKGGQVTTTVIVEGPIAAVEEALKLPGVRSASLDCEFELIRPLK